MQASAVEVFQLADEGALIGGTAAVLFACTLVVSALAATRLRLICNSVPSPCRICQILVWTLLQGLAVGFVLLRVEALVEEGKI